MISLFLFLFSVVAQAKPGPLVDLFPYGEKVGIAKPEKAPATIDLEMARGEYEIFSATLPGISKEKWVTNPRLVWQGAKPKLQLNTYFLGVHHFKASSYQKNPSGEVADIPVPLEWVQKKWLTLPVENRPSHPAYLFEILTDPEGPPGEFHGELSFEWNKQTYKIPVHLKIHSTVLPKKFDLETSFGFAPWDVLRKHFGKWNKGHMDLYETYERAALEHRIDFHKLYVKYPEEGAEDPLADGPVQNQTFLGQTEGLFEGDMNSSGFQMKVTDLPIPLEYKKVKNSTVSREKLEAFWKKMNATVLKHDLKDRTFVYFVDEPKKEDLAEIGEDLRTIRKWAPDLRFLVTTPYRNSLEGAVNLWCVGLSSLDRPTEKPAEFYNQRSDKSEKFWIYVGCNAHGCSGPEDPGTPDLVIDRASAYQRAFPWMALRYKAQGILYYDTVYGYSKGTSASPWKDAFNFTGYGEGNLFYPCTASLGQCREPRVIPSLRLKILRDGLEDAQILTMALAVSPTLEESLQKVVGGVKNFKKGTEDYEKVKRLALQALDGPPKPEPK